MILVFSYIIPIDVASAILLWPHELAGNMQSNEVVLVIACFIEFDFGFASFFNVITENQTEPSFKIFNL